jgi:hypothetical protein
VPLRFISVTEYTRIQNINQVLTNIFISIYLNILLSFIYYIIFNYFLFDYYLYQIKLTHKAGSPMRLAAAMRRRAAPGATAAETGKIELIPTCGDRYPFHRDYFARRQGALCAAVPALQAKRDAGFGQKNPASGGMKPAIGCVAALARCLASRCAPRLPDGRFDAMKWVPITAGWYQGR